jgi:poly(ADP-ribose) glycohydrolase ARH3
MESRGLRSKFEGSMLGLAVGDALGKPAEGMTRREIKEKFGRIENILDGRYTDETEMMIAAAESIVECKGFVKDHMAQKLQENFHKEREYDYETMQAIKKYKPGALPPFSSLNNGAASRIVPVALFYYDNPEEEAKAAREASAITHAHPLIKEACWFFARSISLALDHKKKDILLKLEKIEISEEAKKENYAVYEGLKLLASFNSESNDEPEEEEAKKPGSSSYQGPLELHGEFNPQSNRFNRFGQGVFALQNKLGVDSTMPKTLAAASYSFLALESFREALVYAVNLGGDTDSVAALTGAAAGAYWGIESIPQEWVDKLESRELLFELAEKIYEIKFQK